MRIGMVLDWEYPPDPRVTKEAKTLLRAGHEVHLLCLDHTDQQTPEEIGGLNVHRWRYNRRWKKKLSALMVTVPLHRWLWKKAIKSFVKSCNIEALHCHDMPLVSAVLPVARKSDIPIVLDLHETFSATVASSIYANSFLGRMLISIPRWQAYEKRWITRADHVIVVTEEMRERDINAKGVDPHRITAVPNYTDLETFRREDVVCTHAHLFEGRKVALHAGIIDPIRGLDGVIRAVPEVLKSVPNLLVMMVGDGAYRAHLEKLTQELGVGDAVFFAGRQPANTLPSYVALADVGLAPLDKVEQTLTTSPNKLTEYMALGLPVLVTDCGAPARLIETSGAGVVVQPKDPASIAEGLITILTHPDPPWGERGRRAVYDRLNWEQAGAALIDVYENLATKNCP